MSDSIEALLGLTLVAVDVTRGDGDHEIIFTVDDGRKFKMFHWQCCCESVSIEDICGDVQDLVGAPIQMAEEVSNYEPEKVEEEPTQEDEDYHYEDSHTWTFYKLATVKGYVTIRWYGSSNGWYSESVDFMEVKDDEED